MGRHAGRSLNSFVLPLYRFKQLRRMEKRWDMLPDTGIYDYLRIGGLSGIFKFLQV